MTNAIDRAYLLLIFAVAAFLLFYNLDGQYLWQDEAETASLAKNIFKFGVPKAYDGRNIVLFDFFDSKENYFPGYLWKAQPWFAIYIAHLSFRLFGMTTYAARFPFVFFGLFSLWVAYLLAERLFRKRSVSYLTLLFFTFSVPLILHARQCRYYAPGIFFTLLAVYLYLDYIEKKTCGAALLGCLFLLFNTSASFFITTATGIAAHLYLTQRPIFLSKRNLRFLAGLFLLSCLAVLYLITLPRRVAPLDVDWYLHNVRYYLRSINRYIFPWRGALVLFALYAILRRRLRLYLSQNDRRALVLISAFILSAIPYLVLVNCNSLRYVIHLAPLLYILLAYISSRYMDAFPRAASIGVLALIFTNVMSLSLPLQNYLPDYLYEITHDYYGPVEGIITFLKTNAKPTDTVKITYDDNACIFYTDLTIANRQPFDDGTYPEWVIPRRSWNGRAFYESNFFKEIQKRYDEIEIPYPDLQWENRPDDMGYHKYRTDRSVPNLRIYKRRT